MTGSFDINQYLADTKRIAVIWGIEDVQAVRPDLNADQAWEVLQEVSHRASAERGITWDTLLDVAAELCGPVPDEG
ncbi:MAG TPA: hypothetical protein VHR66_01155 [Gemmataceae bacterium]|nr:hypothetical protein [Gemmataceae bacterium]